MKPSFFLPRDPSLQPVQGINEEHLARFHAARGLVLPESLVELLRIQNGGSLRYGLFVSQDDEGEHSMEWLSGIGEACAGPDDLLKTLPLTDEEGNDVSQDVVLLDYEPYRHTALDYRDCGPQGEPCVISISNLEEPTIIWKVADNFQEFLDGLQRGYCEFYVGFVDVEDVDDLAKSLSLSLVAKIRKFDDEEFGTRYCFYSLAWTNNQSIVFMPNTDAYFPEFPEYSWMLVCNMPTKKFIDVWEKLDAGDYSGMLLHQPVSRDDDWELDSFRVARPTLLQRLLPSALATWLEPIFGFKLWTKPEPLDRPSRPVEDEEFDLLGIQVLWPGSLGSASVGERLNSDTDPEKNIYDVSGDHHSLHVDEGRLSIRYLGSDFHFGTVSKGDRIVVVDENTVVVNGEKRSPE